MLAFVVVQSLSHVWLFVTSWTEHTRLLCPLLSPRICSNSCPLSQGCHPTISSSAVPFSCPQYSPASGSFPIRWLFVSGDQNIDASASVLPMNIQCWFSLELTGLIFMKRSEVKWSEEVKRSESGWLMRDSLRPHGLYSPWNSPGQNTEMSSLSLLHGIFPTQGSNPGLTLCRWILYQLSHKGSARILEWVTYPFSSRSSQSRNRTGVSCIAGGFFTGWATGKPNYRQGWDNSIY